MGGVDCSEADEPWNLDTGGIVAAATTSLPESIGGSRNWDYRYVWLRDAALTLDVLVCHGFIRVAEHWRMWLLRAIAGGVVASSAPHITSMGFFTRARSARRSISPSTGGTGK